MYWTRPDEDHRAGAPAVGKRGRGTVDGVTRRQALLLRAFCAWTVFVWVVFVRNILRDDTHSSGFKVVHTVLAVVSVAFAVAAWIVVRHLRRPSRGAGTSGNVDAVGEPVTH
jgi:hypothetical protein